MVDASLVDDLLQHVTQPSREDEDGHVVLLQAVEKLLVAVPVKHNTYECNPQISTPSMTQHLTLQILGCLVPEGSVGLSHHLCQFVLF